MTIKIKVNGEDREVEAGESLSDFIGKLGLRTKVIVVERNRGIVPRDTYRETTLNDGDVLEIVHLVGGG